MLNLIYSKLDSPFPNYKIKTTSKTFAFLKTSTFTIGIEAKMSLHLSTFVKKYIYACVRFLTVTSWHAHFWYVPLHDIFAQLISGIWQKVLRVCSPDMAIFVCRMLKKSTFGEIKNFHSKEKIHIPNMSPSCDIYSS